ncbi:MAG: PLP-dependent lyase/thiolase [Candidatus Micrarchaeota archaeon]|nr:PLP-dependent lyase/thiolase [Candidatus Micrarchaeota archaeon]
MSHLQLESISVPGNTPMKNISGLFNVSKLFMKDETKNPTHTFKDRLAYEMVRPIIENIMNGKPFEKTSFGAISYGNTAYSMGHYCKLLNGFYGGEIVRAIAFMPPQLLNRPFGPNTEGTRIDAKRVVGRISEFCTIIPIDLNAQIYHDSDLEMIAKKEGAMLDKFTNISDGLDRPAYVKIIKESIETQLKFAPDYVIVPFGAGILCNEIIDYVKDNELKTKVIPVSSGNPNTIAIMLYGVIWVETERMLSEGKGMTKHPSIDLKGRAREQYFVYHVADQEIIKAMNVLSAKKLSAEASGAAGFAILPRLKQIDPSFDASKHSVLVINTGNGLLNYQIRLQS